MSTLEERLSREPEGWRPSPGDQLIGTVLDIDTRTSDYGEGVYPLLLVETTDDKLYAVHAFHTVLKSELARRRPNIGDRIGIRYSGIPDGKKYEHYRVELERPTVAPDWDAIGQAADDELVDDLDEPDEKPF